MPHAASVLISQVGYPAWSHKRAYLRSAIPAAQPTLAFTVERDDGEPAYTGTARAWGEMWGSHWWILDFTSIVEPGSYRLIACETTTNAFEIRDDIFAHPRHRDAPEQLDLLGIAVDQLDARLKRIADPDAQPVPGWDDGEYVPGWRDCGTEIRELSSHIITLHALSAMLENESYLRTLDSNDRQRLIDHAIWGMRFLLVSQERSANPLTDGRFDHDGGRQSGAHAYHNWHDTAYALTAIVRTHMVLCRLGVDRAEFLDAARRGYRNLVGRPYNLESDIAGRTDAHGVSLDGIDATEEVDALARTVYHAPDDFHIPRSLKTKDKLVMVWACTLLHEATGEAEYLERAIAFADAAAERQFLDWEHPIDGAYGCFYAFERNDSLFALEWNQNHKYHMGNIEPTCLHGLIDLCRIAPHSAKIARWRNMLRAFAEGYVKRAAEKSPLGIYPLTMYRHPVHGGISYFRTTNHGATGMYGQAAETLARLAAVFQDASYLQLACNNLNFIAGLNPGIPEAFEERSWSPRSLIVGMGASYFYAQHALLPAPRGSGINGFSADVQFQPTPLGTVPDAPRGILLPDGTHQFNEDYLPHSHGYVVGAAVLERPHALTVVAQRHGVPVDACAFVHVGGETRMLKMADGTADLAFPIATVGRIEVRWNGMSLERRFLACGGAQEMRFDFASHLALSLHAPKRMSECRAEALLVARNLGSAPIQGEIAVSADGVEIDVPTLPLSLGAGKSLEIPLHLRAGCRAMPYTIIASVEIDGIRYRAEATGCVCASALRPRRAFAIHVESQPGGRIEAADGASAPDIPTLEGESLTLVVVPDEGMAIDALFVDGEPHPPRHSLMMTNIGASHAVRARFVPLPHEE